jgi:hypothetical protein
METYRILEIATKKASTGNEYWVVRTDRVKFSTFKKDEYDKVKLALDQDKGIELEILKEGNFNNLKKVGELKEQVKTTPEQKGSGYQSGDRILVDTGNILQRATDLTIAVIQHSKETENARDILKEAVDECITQFKRIKEQLETPEKPKTTETTEEKK